MAVSELVVVDVSVDVPLDVPLDVLLDVSVVDLPVDVSVVDVPGVEVPVVGVLVVDVVPRPIGKPPPPPPPPPQATSDRTRALAAQGATARRTRVRREAALDEHPASAVPAGVAVRNRAKVNIGFNCKHKVTRLLYYVKTLVVTARQRGPDSADAYNTMCALP